MGSQYEITYWDYTQGVYSTYWRGEDKETALQKLDECAKEWYCVSLTVEADDSAVKDNSDEWSGYNHDAERYINEIMGWAYKQTGVQEDNNEEQKD